MRKLILLVGLVCLGLLSAAIPANATDQGAAVQMCEKNPNCSQVRNGAGINMSVKLPTGGTNEVWCPDSGPCECITCGAPKQRSRSLGYLIRQFVVPQSLSSPGSDSGPAIVPSAPPAPPPTDDGPIL